MELRFLFCECRRRSNYRESLGLLVDVIAVTVFVTLMTVGESDGTADNKCLDVSGKYDLTPLSRFVWNVSQKLDSEVYEYRIRLCELLESPVNCATSSVCRLSRPNDESSAVSLGFRESSGLEIDKDDDDVGFWLKFRGSSCPGGGRYRTFINMQCGTGLGSPMIIGVYDCRTYFRWETSVACENTTEMMVPDEVPCYVYDAQGNRHDLNGLRRTKGGHFIPTAGSNSVVRFYINVCASIVSDAETSICPSGSAACRIEANEAINFGRSMNSVQMTSDGKIRLVYENNVHDSDGFCAHRSTQTTVTFSCPSDGRSRNPIIVSNNDCNYQIEWVTVVACPLTTIHSLDACHLKSDINGIDEDISPIRVINGIPHHVDGRVEGKNFDFYISVCGDFPSDFSCSSDSKSNKSARVCRKSVDDHQGVILGSSTNESLRLVDGQLYLSYEGGSPCYPTGSSRSRIALIHLKCGSSIDDHQLRFIQEEECVTFFEWETKHACIHRMVGTACYVNDGDRVVDLSMLTRGQGEEPWLAVGDRDANEIYVNVCGPVGRVTSSANCPAGSSVCVKGDDGKMIDFGQYEHRPEIDSVTGDVRLNYTSREPCPSNVKKLKSSIIRFICHPGDLDSGPRLISTSLDGCSMEFEWTTAAACTQSQTNGTGCKIDDIEMGLNFDLSGLEKIDGQYYNITVGEYDYFLNVCGDVKGSVCSTDSGVGACQIERGHSNVFWNLGSATDVLTYYNGQVKMTYENGTGNRRTVISFLCDRDSGIGYPEFVDVTREVHNFKWKTSFVCPPRPVQCVFINDATMEQYDLSSLSRGSLMGDWIVTDMNSKGTKRKFYLNVCRNLTRSDEPIRSACDGGAAICATQLINDEELPLIGNLGRAESAPRFENGQLTIRYTSGEPCKDLTRPGVNYSAVIYFHCGNYSIPSEEGPGPIFLRNRSCEYMFMWSNQAACPLRNAFVGSSCAVTDSITGYSFSFNSLNSEFIVPAQTSNTFKSLTVNICGSVNSSACGMEVKSEHVAVCGQLKDTETSVIVATSKSRRVYVTNVGTVKMEFDGHQNVTSGKPDYRVEIIFLCHRDLISPKPRFVRQEDDLLVLEYESPLTCPPQVVDCVFNDRRGNTYDLSSLAIRGHYEIKDPRVSNGNILYHLSVCRPLLIPPFSNCPERLNIGACMSDSKSGIGYSLGYVQGKPSAGLVDDATVSLLYHSGSSCKNGTGHMNTRIDFRCSSHHGEPRFVDESFDCEYRFLWETPFACPVQQTIGSDCQVTDRRYSTRFDLSNLKKSTGYIVVDSGLSINATSGIQRRFRINACGPLSVECGGLHDVGVCVDDGNGEFKSSGGYFSNKLVYEQGEITLRYDGDGEKSSIIRFVCDHSTTGQTEGPSYLAAASGQTSYVFVWKTSYACREFQESKCRVYFNTADNDLYDLGRLTLPDENYEVIVNNGTYKYLINVCRSVVHAKDAMCHYASAVCGVNLTEVNIENKYSNLGQVGDVGPTFENGVLVLSYGMGEMCRTNGAAGLHKTTTIRFSCDPKVEQGKPYLLAENGCHYEFGWSTAMACPIQDSSQISHSDGDCTAVNPNNGYKFDLNSLRRSSYNLEISETANMTIIICDAIKETACDSGAGSCVSEYGSSSLINTGRMNANLQYTAGMLYLNYTDGVPCSSSDGIELNSTTRTVITFSCAKDEPDIDMPRFVERVGCTYYVSWYTKLACETQVHCSVELDHEMLDLSPLMELHGHHFAIGNDGNDDAVYILNVCRPISSLTAPHCPAQAAACRYNGETISSISLGVVERAPYIASDGHVVLEYKNGSQCPRDSSLNASTKIIFLCDESFMHDVVRLVDVTDDCTYVFEWPTNVVCPVVTHGLVSANCSYFDTRTKGNFDLARLRDLSPAGYQVPYDEIDGGVFSVDFCGNQIARGDKYGPCALAAVCLRVNGGDETSWGASSSAIYDYDGQHLRVSYKDGDSCPDFPSKRKSSVIWFACDGTAGPGTPELTKSFDCQAIFYWRSSLMCHGSSSRSDDCTVFNQGRQLYDLRLLSSYSHSWIVEINKSPTKERFWINVCGQLVGERDHRCPPQSAVCWMPPSEDRVFSIGSSDTQTLTVSDDGRTLVLQYSVNRDVCSRSSERSVISESSTRSVIEFTCSPKANEPQLVARGNEENNCTFTFRWETPIACPTNSPVELLELDGRIVDPDLDLVVDLSPVLKNRDTALEHRGDDDYIYVINLLGSSFQSDGECNGAAICQTKSGDDSFQRNIGRAADRRYFLQGPELVIKLKSDSACGRVPDKNVTSLITMRCSPSSGDGKPVFVYESVDCNYVFDWESETVCAVEAANRGVEIVPVNKSSGNSIAVISVTLTILLIVIVVALLVLRKRRTILMFVLKWCPTSLSSYRQQSRHGSVSFARLDDETESANIIC